jgi:alpha-1,2-mannosyltransferase
MRNLALNFNIWFVLALASGPLFAIQYLLRQRQQRTLTRGIRSAVFLSPFYIWLAIFTSQPHKEERFMYPAYPALALNAAIAMHIILSYIGQSDPKKLIGKIPTQLKFFAVLLVVLGGIGAGLLRTIGTVTAYSAPLRIYGHLQHINSSESVKNVCIGKEWYRYPSSYFLPDNLRLKFVKSEFDGLLPGEFSEVQEGLTPRPGTYLLPSGMNDRNTEDPGKHVSFLSIDHLHLVSNL